MIVSNCNSNIATSFFGGFEVIGIILLSQAICIMISFSPFHYSEPTMFINWMIKEDLTFMIAKRPLPVILNECRG